MQYVNYRRNIYLLSLSIHKTSNDHFQRCCKSNMHSLEGVQLDLHFAYSKSKRTELCKYINSKTWKHVLNENLKKCLLKALAKSLVERSFIMIFSQIKFYIDCIRQAGQKDTVWKTKFEDNGTFVASHKRKSHHSLFYSARCHTGIPCYHLLYFFFIQGLWFILQIQYVPVALDTVSRFNFTVLNFQDFSKSTNWDGFNFTLQED